LISDHINVGVLVFEVLLEVERDHELVNVTTVFSLLGLLFDSGEVFVQLI
jgi:hypothetical protein